MTARERVRESMASVDTAWLRMDRPSNLMQIIGVMIFSGRLDAEHFKRIVATRLLRYPRFRQIAELSSDGAWWVDDENFDIDAHIRRSLLPAPGASANSRSSSPSWPASRSIRRDRAGTIIWSIRPTATRRWLSASIMQLLTVSR